MKQQKVRLLYSLVGMLLLGCLFYGNVIAQDKGRLSGDLQLNTKFYERDSARNAFNTPFYDDQFYGADAWFTLNYQIKGFDIGLRFDAFQNTAIFNPTVPRTEQGIGRWYIAKSIDKLRITAGYFYEQYASGAIFRAYEARALGIDQAIMGINLEYTINDNWRLKGFTGRQKNVFDLYTPLVKGLNLEGFVSTKSVNGKSLSLIPGFAIVNRTLDSKTMDEIVGEINTYTLADRFVPKFNTYLLSFYNTLQFGKISWYLEIAGKTADVLRDIEGLLINPESGYMGYTTLSYAQKGLGIVLSAKYTEKFDFRVSPNEIQTRGILNFLPPMTRQNTYRLLSRYNPATQTLGELALQFDITYKPSKSIFLTGNYTDIKDLDGNQLFREIYTEVEWRPRKKPYRLTSGLQFVDYNQAFFEQKGDWVHTMTPFSELTYKFSRKKSMRFELQYMLTKRNYRLFGQEDPNPEKPQDFGDWIWGLVEFNMAPHWSFGAGNMHSFGRNLSFFNVFGVYAKDASRFSLSYGKQPDGVICTGGICRFEPAFSGLRFDITTNF